MATGNQNQDVDPLVKRAVADAVVERASSELQKLMHELAGALDPFPGFMGLESVQALEVEPSGIVSPDRGCVVVCPDGELRELLLRILPSAMDSEGVDQTEEMRDLDLSPGDFVAYAHLAVREMARIIEERQQGRA